MKVLHLPTTVGGQGWGLAQAERKIGLDSSVLIRRNNILNYPCNMSMELEKCNNGISKFIKSLQWVYKVCRSDYDILHFNFGSTIMDLTHIGFGEPDLPFYKKKGRGLFVTFNGCDVRQKYKLMKEVEFSACHNNLCSEVCNNPVWDRRKQKNVEKFDKYVDGIFAITPDLLRFLPKRAIYLPKTISSWDSIEKTAINKRKKISIIHAPTDRIIKGTDYIVKAINQVKRKYGDVIEFTMIENMSHQDAIKAYNDADVVIDQLMIGWYGGFAVEVMKMGKPVMCFMRDEDFQYVDSKMARDCKETIINIKPDNIYDKICEFIENRNLLEYYGGLSYEYVNKWHDPVRVAKMVKGYYEEALIR